jgi:hypothetical protein
VRCAARRTQVAALFPEPVINFCGDEVQFECLDSNPAVKKWANDHNMTYFQLEQHFWERMAEPGGVLEALASHIAVVLFVYSRPLFVCST